MDYFSQKTVESQISPGVRFKLKRCSFSARLALIEEIGQMSSQAEFLRAGAEANEQLKAAAVNQKIEKAYLKAGLQAVEGLTIDGTPATPELLIDKGPEELCREALQYVRLEFELSEDERKNFSSPSTTT